MRILVTGAAGFIGSALLKSLIDDSAAPEIVAVDLTEPPAWAAAGPVHWICGGVDDCTVMDAIFRDEFDLVFHLSSVPGALAEADPRLGRRVNLHASLDLLERLAATSRCPRVVYASSIAVYGPSSGPVSSRTPPRPAITYGTHKRIVEIALADHSRRGEMSGISVRLPGIVARPGTAAGFGSAFMSELLHALAAGEPYCCPVSPGATMWWLSIVAAVNNLMHAAAIAHCGTIQLPALHLTVEDVVEGFAEADGMERASLVQYRPDERMEATYGRFPELDAAEERALGFTDDGSVATLIRNALAQAGKEWGDMQEGSRRSSCSLRRSHRRRRISQGTCDRTVGVPPFPRLRCCRAVAIWTAFRMTKGDSTSLKRGRRASCSGDLDRLLLIGPSSAGWVATSLAVTKPRRHLVIIPTGLSILRAHDVAISAGELRA